MATDSPTTTRSALLLHSVLLVLPALAEPPVPIFGVPSLLDLAKILGVPVAMFLMARYLTRRDKRRDEAAAAALKANTETANERKAYREARLAAEKTNASDIAKEHTDRILWQLENAADWERVVSILKEFGEVQRLLAVVATTTQHHGAELSALTRRMDDANKHLNDFIIQHVLPKVTA